MDLARRARLEVLADRERTTVQAGLKKHPEVEEVVRDRGKDVAKAATAGAPQAQQVVDRFPAVNHRSEGLAEILGHCRADMRQGEATASEEVHTVEERASVLPTVATWQQGTPARVKHAHHARQASRDDRSRQMTAWRAQGVTHKEVAKRMGMSERAVRRWLKQGAAPAHERRFRRRRVFDPYAAAVRQRWQDGGHEAKQRSEDIQAQGFPGTVRMVPRCVQARRDNPEKMTRAPATGADRCSSLHEPPPGCSSETLCPLTPTPHADGERICPRSETAGQT